MDEGTVFASGSFNVTSVALPYHPDLRSDRDPCRTEKEFRDYLHQFYFPRAPRTATSLLAAVYPNDPAQGSPFGTGDANQLAPMYKRMSSFQGDMIFQAPRRFFLDQRSAKQPTWSFSKPRRHVHTHCG